MKRWIPNCTVATLVHNAGKFLLVEEYDKLSATDLPVLNQPAGHLEVDESLIKQQSEKLWKKLVGW